jgi:hypothetical protein
MATQVKLWRRTGWFPELQGLTSGVAHIQEGDLLTFAETDNHDRKRTECAAPFKN